MWWKCETNMVKLNNTICFAEGYKSSKNQFKVTLIDSCPISVKHMQYSKKYQWIQ